MSATIPTPPDYISPDESYMSEPERAHLAIRRATDYASEGCGLLESVALLISQRDNARTIAEAYQKRLGEYAESVRRTLAERKRYAEAEALLLRARDECPPDLAHEILATLERHKLERTASPRAQVEAAGQEAPPSVAH